MLTLWVCVDKFGTSFGHHLGHCCSCLVAHCAVVMTLRRNLYSLIVIDQMTCSTSVKAHVYFSHAAATCTCVVHVHATLCLLSGNRATSRIISMSVFCEPHLCLVYAFCHLICLHPVPPKATQPMELIRLAGRYQLREKIMSGPSRTYGAIALSQFTHMPR